MLKSHIDSKEQVILANSGVAHHAGHTRNRGTPREIFIRDFLSEHLSEKVAIGTGEVIDSRSSPRQSRNQIDIVLYKREYPKLHIGGGIHAFLAESVVATIEVKSLLTQAELDTSIGTAATLKSLNRSLAHSFRSGYQPPSILNYVVAYGGPASMETVNNWIGPIHQARGISAPPLPIDESKRYKTPSPSLDGIFVLGKGFIQYDNSPMGFISQERRHANPLNCWAWSDLPSGSLLLLFTLLTQSVSGVSGSWLDPAPYLANFGAKTHFTP